MAKGWYVVHAFSGHENKVKKQIELLKTRHGATLFDIKVPSEEVIEMRDGKKRVTSKKFLPGYVLVEMDLPEHGWKDVCSDIRRVAGVTGFVGTTRTQKPQPISQEEARSILQKAGEIKSDRSIKPRMTFTEGEAVRIVDGPFNSFSGNIEEVNVEKGKLRVMVGIFGRATPVELDFYQVEKI